MALVRFAALLASLLAASGLMSLTGHAHSGRLTNFTSAPILPLVFEENRGQAGPSARFVARVPGGTVLLTPEGAEIKLQTPSTHHPSPSAPGARSATVRMRLTGARSAPMLGEGLLPGKTHYLRGRDPKKWRRDLPLYERVNCPDVYPGVDLVYHTAAAPRLEYDFVVAPGADPSTVCVEFTGVEGASLDAAGDLVLATPVGEVRQLRPVAYQVSGEGRTPVEARYVLAGSPVRPQVCFAVGDYDLGKPLIIDPVLTYSSYLGGSGGPDRGLGIAAAADGTVYVVGETSNDDFPTSGEFQGPQGGIDAFVVHLDPSRAGAAGLIYGTYLGGSSVERVGTVAVASDGSACVVGDTFSPDYPTTPQAFQPNFAGSSDAFVAKLTPDGSALLYSSYLGGSGSERGEAVALDSSGKIYVAVTTGSSDYPTKLPFQTDQTSLDAAVTKLNPLQSGAASMVFSTYLGGSSLDETSSIAVDSVGRVHVAGLTASDNFPVTATAFATTRGGDFDAFVAKLNAAGTTLLYGTYLGGAEDDRASGLALDGAGSIYVAGETASANFPVTSTGLAAALRGLRDGFVSKINPSVSGAAALAYSTYLGGSSDDFASAIGIDANSNVYVTGDTASSDFPITVQAFQTQLPGTGGAFLARLDPSRTGANSLRSSSYLGGSGSNQGGNPDHAGGIAVTSAGVAYLTGVAQSPDFPTTVGAFQDTLVGGGGDAFVAQITPSLPSAPLNLFVTTLSASQLKLSWLDKSINETGFEIQRKSGGGAFQFLVQAGPNATTFTDSNLPAATFTYRVRAVNEEGPSAFSNEAPGATLPPTAPGNLTAAAFAGFVSLHWTDSIGESSYIVERKPANSANFTVVGAPGRDASAFNDTVSTNLTFVYRVRALNPLGEALSNEAGVTTLGAPTGLTVTNSQTFPATHLKLLWTDNSLNLESGFAIQRKGPGSTFNKVGQVGANVTVFTDTGLTPNTFFTYRVQAVNSTGNSSFSNQASGTTARIPVAPSDLTAKAVSGTQVRLHWQDNSFFELGFRIERAADGEEFVEAGRVGKEGTEFLDSGLAPRTAYTYRVAAFNDGGDSPFSNEAEVRTPAGPRGRLEVANEVRFPSTAVGSQTTAFLRLRNRSRREGLLVIAEQPFAPFGASPPLRVKIGPGEIRLLRLIFRPVTPGVAEGVLRLHSSDPHHTEVFVRLVGEGAPP